MCASCCSHAGDVGHCVKELSLVYLPAVHKHSWESSCYLGYFGVKSIKEKKHGKRGSRAGLLHALCMCQGETSSTVVGGDGGGKSRKSSSPCAWKQHEGKGMWVKARVGDL